uniref:Uncharacterized protein n=1 Tax=Anguilla anguilla TaxID=7936 RepID=A0A0E9XRT3_ANGAN
MAINTGVCFMCVLYCTVQSVFTKCVNNDQKSVLHSRDNIKRLDTSFFPLNFEANVN